MADQPIRTVSRPFVAKLSPPGSKSLTNRALVLAAMASGICKLTNVLFADDTKVMLDSLGRLGFELLVDEPAHTVDIRGRAGKIPAKQADLSCGNSGTTLRFLTALCALGYGQYTLDGVERMRQRPIGELVGLLKHLGSRITYTGEIGFPPVRLDAKGLAGGIIRFGSAQSSQFLSAVLMASPYARHEVVVDLEPDQTSWPYVTMTMRLMDDFHHTCHLIRDPQTGQPRQIIVPRGSYTAQTYAIEPDASNATYFAALAALHEGAKVTILGLNKNSIQGDVGFARVLADMGAQVSYDADAITVEGVKELTGVDVDLSDMPDTAQTLAVTAMFARGVSVLRGLRTLRVKETDRLAALQTELTKLGAAVDVRDDVMTIEPPLRGQGAEIDTYDDHRMAMSFALAGTKIPGVVIKDAQCVNKTYPEYFADFERVVASV